MEFILKYWTQIIFFGTVLLAIIKYCKNMNEATKCSLRNDMITIYDKCKIMKQISEHDLEAFQKSFEIYEKLKGNGYIKKIKEKIEKFEVID